MCAIFILGYRGGSRLRELRGRGRPERRHLAPKHSGAVCSAVPSSSCDSGKVGLWTAARHRWQ